MMTPSRRGVWPGFSSAKKVDFRIVQSEFMFYCFGAQKHRPKSPRLLLVGGADGDVLVKHPTGYTDFTVYD